MFVDPYEHRAPRLRSETWGTRPVSFILNDERNYSVITRSAHSTRDTKMVGLPNFAPH